MAACASMPNRIQLITVSSVSEIIVGPLDEPVTKLSLLSRHRIGGIIEPSRPASRVVATVPCAARTACCG